MKLVNTTRSLGLAALAALALAALTPALPGARAADEKKPAPAAQTASPAAGKPVPAAARMDINSASEAELATLKGIGEARAKAIVKGRPYGGKDDLVKRKIIPQGVYDGIKDEIIARQK